ncbi:hypothetical protein COL154_014387, partial [Colletotrichum chrysophilum]
ALDHGAHNVGITMTYIEADEAGAGIGVDKRTAFPRLRNVGLIDDLSRAAGSQPGLDPADEIAMAEVASRLAQQVGGEAEHPIDIECRGHVGLHLRDHAGDRQGDDIAGSGIVEMDLVDGRGPHVDARRPDDRAGDVAAAAAYTGAEGGHHHIDIAEDDGGAGAQAGRDCCRRRQRMCRHGAIDNFGEQRAPMRQAECFDDGVVVLSAPEIAESEARLRRIRRPNARKVEIEPVLAVEGRLGTVQNVGLVIIHMGELAALLAGVETGTRRFETCTAQRSRRKPLDCRCGSRIEP